MPSFQELHGMRACLVAPTKIIAGEQAWEGGGGIPFQYLGLGHHHCGHTHMRTFQALPTVLYH